MLILIFQSPCIARSYRNAISIDYTFDSFSRTSSYGPWHLSALQYKRYLNKATIIGRINYANRNYGSGGNGGMQGEIDLYPKIKKGMYAYINFGYSGAGIFPKYRFGAEIYKSLPKSFEGSIGIRYLNYSTTKVPIYTFYIGKYYGNYWISLRPYITSKSSGASYSVELQMRRYFSDSDNYILLKTKFGSTPDENTLEEIQRLGSNSIGVGFNKKIGSSFILRSTLEYEREEYRISTKGNRYSFSIGIEKSFL